MQVFALKLLQRAAKDQLANFTFSLLKTILLRCIMQISANLHYKIRQI